MSFPRQRRIYRWLKRFLLSGLIILTIFIVRNSNLLAWLPSVFRQIKALGNFGPIAFILVYNLATVLFIPGSLLTIKGGCLFGFFWGSIYVLIGALLGTIFAFLIGRYFSRDWVTRKMAKSPNFKAISEAVKEDGWKIVLLIRLCPFFPFNLLNYVFGVTQISLRDYILGSLGILPATLMYVYIGSLVTDLTGFDGSDMVLSLEAQKIKWMVHLLGLIATLVTTIYTTRLARKILNQRLKSYQ